MTGSPLTAARLAESIEAVCVPPGRDRVRMGEVFTLANQFIDPPYFTTYRGPNASSVSFALAAVGQMYDRAVGTPAAAMPAAS
jgi:hypothetical protein